MNKCCIKKIERLQKKYESEIISIYTRHSETIEILHADYSDRLLKAISKERSEYNEKLIKRENEHKIELELEQNNYSYKIKEHENAIFLANNRKDKYNQLCAKVQTLLDKLKISQNELINHRKSINMIIGQEQETLYDVDTVTQEFNKIKQSIKQEDAIL